MKHSEKSYFLSGNGSESLVGVHSVPRSGSSWLGEIFNSSPLVSYKYQPLFSYALKSYISDHSCAEELRGFFDELKAIKDPFIDQEEDRIKGVKPVFAKKAQSHLVYKEVRYHYVIENCLQKLSNYRCILLVRCPLAVLNSFHRAPREFRADLGWDFQKEWRFAQSKNKLLRENYFGFEKWKEAALMFEVLQEKFPSRVLIVNYNELVSDTFDVVSNIFKWAGIEMNDQTRGFLDGDREGRPKGPYSVFSSRLEDKNWVGKLDQTVVDYVTTDLGCTPLRKYLSIE